MTVTKRARFTADEIYDFAKAWNKAESVDAVLKDFDLTRTQACALATRVRKVGGKMKKMPRGAHGGVLTKELVARINKA